MKTLYIHIGTPKTATTSLQNFCKENEEILEEQGYCYPIFPHKFKRISLMRNGFFLTYKAYNEDRTRNTLEEEAFFRQGMDFVLAAFEKHDNVILSDEAIWSVVFKRGKPYLWENIKKEAEEHGYRVKVIVYLRRQDSLADSWWNQKVKSGKRVYATSTWEDFVSNPDFLELNYYEPLKIIEKQVGKENMIVRRFGRKYFKNGSIFEDFVDALDMKYNRRFHIADENRNIRLFGNAHEIKRILNGIPNLSDQDNTFFRRIAMDLSEQQDNKGETMFSPDEAEAFMEQYREGNRKVMQEYFGQDEDLFDVDFSKNKKWILDQRDLEKDIISFLGYTAIQLRQENRDLQMQIKNMEQELEEIKKQLRQKKSDGRNPLKTMLNGIRGN